MKPFFLATCLFLTASVSLSKVFDITEIRNQSQSSVQLNFQTIRTQPGDEVRFDVPVHLRHQKLSFVIWATVKIRRLILAELRAKNKIQFQVYPQCLCIRPI